jgi:hypothetical protein
MVLNQYPFTHMRLLHGRAPPMFRLQQSSATSVPNLTMIYLARPYSHPERVIREQGSRRRAATAHLEAGHTVFATRLSRLLAGGEQAGRLVLAERWPAGRVSG